MRRATLLAIAVSLAPAAALAQQSGMRQMVSQLAQADANRDGTVTRAEFTAWRGAQFARLDQNRDGALSAADRAPMGRSILSQAERDAMLAQFDANQDGQVAQDEFVNGPTPAFDVADADKDGAVTRAELRAARTAQR